ncbi:PstS family phosphate ABC transporter substrate-binding protein [Magnetospirillum fulvum]|uniref:ABC-type phosphate transport system, substrate-binding protein n=1 Tax=Magnetospirillum fulvum TaxID=1082 RepID=A0A1H6IJM6_MAGFU|nr:substrate-binding domain-containing protein [Magnetospirillum fulvum]SEH48112.1 ABC-type phosphate transport system, substrate-binding protein [Magnetospirillum fulvum]
MFARHLLLGATILSGLSGLAATAQADQVYSGGASLPAPYLRQAASCYGVDTPLLIKQSSGAATVASPAIPDFNSGTYNCASLTPVSSDTINYVSTGSGTGIKAFFTNNPAQLGTIPSGGNYPDVSFAVSETPLVAADLAAWNSVTAFTYSGLSFKAANGTGSGNENPLATYGEMIQVPALVAAVTLAYNPTYVNADGDTFPFNPSVPLQLTQAQYCGIFNGDITNWNQISTALKADADDTEFNAPLSVVGRSDSSGTTSLFTRHLAGVCGGSTNKYTASTSTLPQAVRNLSNVVTADQSSGVAAAIATAPGSIGYLGLDYVGDYAQHTGSTTASLKAASLQNKAGSFVAPTPASATAAFGNFTAPTGTDLADPTKWVAGTNLDKDASGEFTNKLVNPAGAESYPIVGTSNFLVYTCYSDAAKASAVTSFFDWYYSNDVVNNGSVGVLSYSGLAPVSETFRQSIRDTFIDSNSGNSLHIRSGCTGKAGA